MLEQNLKIYSFASTVLPLLPFTPEAVNKKNQINIYDLIDVSEEYQKQHTSFNYKNHNSYLIGKPKTIEEFKTSTKLGSVLNKFFKPFKHIKQSTPKYNGEYDSVLPTYQDKEYFDIEVNRLRLLTVFRLFPEIKYKADEIERVFWDKKDSRRQKYKKYKNMNLTSIVMILLDLHIKKLFKEHNSNS